MARLVWVALCASLALGAGATAARAARVSADFHLATPGGPGAAVGSAVISDGPTGAVFKMDLHGLPPGQHGFHVHQFGACSPGVKDGQPVPAGAAGGHLDPEMTGKHEGPMGMGHLGDLPALTVAPDGADAETLIAPRLKDVSQLVGHSLMIHSGGDNYSDQPAPLGGGGPRLACAVVQ